MNMIKKFMPCLLFIVFSENSFSANSPLLSDLKDATSDSSLGSVGSEPLYIIQNRKSGLGGVFELGFYGARQFNSNIFVTSEELGGFLSYHLSNRWFAQLEGTQTRNGLTTSGRRLWSEDGVFPDVSFVQKRADLSLGFNLFYGKFRWTRDSVSYFDQYVALGSGFLEQTNGATVDRSRTFVADVGVSSWFFDYLSLRMGCKDIYFKEKRITSEQYIHRLTAYAGVSLLLGGAG